LCLQPNCQADVERYRLIDVNRDSSLHQDLKSSGACPEFVDILL
jgi:hypothetical protein